MLAALHSLMLTGYFFFYVAEKSGRTQLNGVQASNEVIGMMLNLCQLIIKQQAVDKPDKTFILSFDSS